MQDNIKKATIIFSWLIFIISFFLLLKKSRKATIISFFALLIAVSFASWNEILRSTSGGKGKILSLELGYYLWVLSIFVLTIGNYLYFREEKK